MVIRTGGGVWVMSGRFWSCMVILTVLAGCGGARQGSLSSAEDRVVVEQLSKVRDANAQMRSIDSANAIVASLGMEKGSPCLLGESGRYCGQRDRLLQAVKALRQVIDRHALSDQIASQHSTVAEFKHRLALMLAAHDARDAVQLQPGISIPRRKPAAGNSVLARAADATDCGSFRDGFTSGVPPELYVKGLTCTGGYQLFRQMGSGTLAGFGYDCHRSQTSYNACWVGPDFVDSTRAFDVQSSTTTDCGFLHTPALGSYRMSAKSIPCAAADVIVAADATRRAALGFRCTTPSSADLICTDGAPNYTTAGRGLFVTFG
jgi:hypothetical protein